MSKKPRKSSRKATTPRKRTPKGGGAKHTWLPADADDLPPAAFDLRQMEQLMAALTRVLNQRDFASADEANAFLEQLAANGGPPIQAGTTPLELAQDAMYEAWEVTGKQRLALAREALELSPDCADAYVLLAQESAPTMAEARALLEEGVRAGARALGAEYFEQEVGNFWGMLESRPYMRARAALAECLWRMGEHGEAIAHAQDLLRLNPGDNQGIRYTLLAWLLFERDADAAGVLLALYEDDAMAAWLYGRALHRFGTAGESDDARAALDDALEQNPHVPAYLLGRRRLPKQMPALVGWGDESEAVDYAAAALPLWQGTPGALDWLARASG